MMRAIFKADSWRWLLPLLLLLTGLNAGARAESTLRIIIGHSTVLELDFKVASIAMGSPAIARATPVSGSAILVNAIRPGTTSMLVFDKGGLVKNYRILVTHDLTHLQNHLWTLDRRLRVDSDPNGDAVILAGTAANKAIAERAVEAAYRVFGESQVALQTNPRRRDRVDQSRRAADGSVLPGGASAAAGAESVAGIAGDGSYINESISEGVTRIINLIVTDEALVAAPLRLQRLLQQVDPAIVVQEVNGVFFLKGQVATPAALGRAVTLADRFVSSSGEIDVKVFSDRGGVLAGNIDSSKTAEPVTDGLSLPRFSVGGQANLGRRGGQIGNTTAINLGTELSEGKGNLAQNISRGDVIVAAGGRVVSMLTLREQPRVEVKMNIVAIDRTRTDKLGINWRLDGSRVSIDTTGATIGTPPNNPFTQLPNLEVGGVTAVGKVLSGFATVQSFVQALKEKGIAQSVSEPLLTAVSGESSSFLVGGNIPIPVETIVAGNVTQNAIRVQNVEFLEFGLRIVVRPTVTESGRISIVLDQIITEPDRSSAIVLNGVSVPGFKQRSIRTLTESGDSETWAVAGLVSDIESTNTSGVPFLSQLPILGALFRNKSDEKSRSELIVTVTARRVGYPVPVPAKASAGSPAEPISALPPGAEDDSARVPTAADFMEMEGR